MMALVVACAVGVTEWSRRQPPPSSFDTLDGGNLDGTARR
jgi:hypothetical protein